MSVKLCTYLHTYDIKYSHMQERLMNAKRNRDGSIPATNDQEHNKIEIIYQY